MTEYPRHSALIKQVKMSLFRNRFRIESARLEGFDYGSNGAYFITIVTQNRRRYFGKIQVNEKQEKIFVPTAIGQLASENWKAIRDHYPFVILDEFVIMPDHMHGILIINKPESGFWKPNKFGPQSRNVPAIIRSYKSSVKRFANENGLEFGWQPRYHEHIIRDAHALHAIRKYIINNPRKW